MKNITYQFTSESVSAGHPDKVADQISDAILDAYLTQDPNAKVACECLISTNYLLIAGEVNSTANVNPVLIAQQVLDAIGYNNDTVGFNWHKAEIKNILHQQSPQIFDSVKDGGAGDQGIMFGYACNDTPEFMPLAISLSHKILQKLTELRKTQVLPWLRPDAKAQVTVCYDENGPLHIDTVVVSTQHDETVTQETIHSEIREKVIEPIIANWLPKNTPTYLINPSGNFTIGGPHGDTGLTGRKIIVDTYGGSCPHGGGAFSGKDPSKVDRSAAYAARFIAKHLVAAGLMDKCTVQLSYAIGVAEPTSIYIDAHGTETCNLQALSRLVYEIFPTKPDDIIHQLNLKSPIYFKTSTFGHFGNDEFPWERLNPSILETLQSEFNPSSLSEGNFLGDKKPGNIRRMTPSEIQRLVEFHVRNVDKFYRMFSGLSSELTDYIDQTVYLKIKMNCKWLKSPYVTAVQLVKDWVHNKELRDAKNYVVKIYFMEKHEQTGINFNANTDLNSLNTILYNFQNQKETPVTELSFVEIRGKVSEDFRFNWLHEECTNFCRLKKN